MFLNSSAYVWHLASPLCCQQRLNSVSRCWSLGKELSLCQKQEGQSSFLISNQQTTGLFSMANSTPTDAVAAHEKMVRQWASRWTAGPSCLLSWPDDRGKCWPGERNWGHDPQVNTDCMALKWTPWDSQIKNISGGWELSCLYRFNRHRVNRKREGCRGGDRHCWLTMNAVFG